MMGFQTDIQHLAASFTESMAADVAVTAADGMSRYCTVGVEALCIVGLRGILSDLPFGGGGLSSGSFFLIQAGQIRQHLILLSQHQLLQSIR